MACDNKQALQLFDPEYFPSPSEFNYDLVQATWVLLQQTKITWKGDHVKGHQDQVRGRSLTRTERLNVEMDHMAKAFWRHLCVHNAGHIPTPLHIPIYGEGWQIWEGDNKIAHPNSHALYGLIQDPITQFYWVRHRHIPEASQNTVDWTATADFMKHLPLKNRRWVTKHASHQCAVGTTMAKWNFQDTAKCPRCNEDETTTHVYQCKSHQATTQWNESIQQLETWLTDQQTNPKLHTTLIDCLQRWRNKQPIIIHSYPQSLQATLQAQQQLGWQQLLEGLPTEHWRKLQHRHYTTTRTRKSSKRWIRGILTQIHHLARKQWQHRNHIKHNVLKPHYQEADRRLNRAIRREFTKGTRHLMPGDKYHVQQNLLELMQRTQSYRKAWLVNVVHARQRGQRIWEHNEELVAISKENSKLFQWMKYRTPLKPRRT